MPVKKTIGKTASKMKKTTATKAAATKKAPATKKAATTKKATTSKKAAVAKKDAAPKKAAASKKAPAAKKTPAPKKAATTKKTTTTKKVASSKKSVADKASATKSQTTAPAKASAKKASTTSTSKKTSGKATTSKAKVSTAAKPKPITPSVITIGNEEIAPYMLKEGEEYMNEAQRQHFIEILRAWKLSLMQEVDRTVSHMKDEAANFPDPNDRASQEEEFSLELRTRDRERKLIKKIDQAISNINEDEYGYCDACGVEIGIRRLEARPTAKLCIDCKTLDEIKERQIKG